MRQTPALLLAFGSPAAAWLKYPFVNSRAEESWTPPRETSPAEHEAQLYQDWSPRPTEAPKPLFGRMGLLPRADGYDLAPGTCGFVASNESMFKLLIECPFSLAHRQFEILERDQILTRIPQMPMFALKAERLAR